MRKLKGWLMRWGPALLMMAVIFIFSSRPSSLLPRFSWADAYVKKGGHMLGYGLLALSFWRGLKMKPGNQAAAWLMAIIYAITDEIHQTLVPGRQASVWDVMIFDGVGALIGLWVSTYYSRKNSASRMVQESSQTPDGN